MRLFLVMTSLCFTFSCSETNKNPYDLSDSFIDVVIPSTKKDLATLDACIDAIRKHGRHIRRIIVVSSKPLTSKAEWFDEANFPFTKKDIALQIFKDEDKAIEYLKNPQNRLGWKYQQLLKLYAAYVIPNISENILILDSDTIFLRDVAFIDENENALLQVAEEYHIPYFEHMKRLLPWLNRVFPEYSGVAHHMLFQKPVLDDLFAHITAQHQTEPWRAICDSIDHKELLLSSFSEYEIYFNFALARSKQVKLRRLKMLDTGECDIDNLREGAYDYVSCHAWMRAK